MLSKSTNAIIPETAVSYKFKVRDFADLFEGMSPEQIHVALEGALNIVFARPKSNMVIVEGAEADIEEQTDEEDQLDHESQVVSNTVFALVAHGHTDDSAPLDESIDMEDTPEYAQMEEAFQSIVSKFAAEVTEDKFNQDVVTLHGEMEYFAHIELFTYFYDTKNEVLSVTLISTPSEETSIAA